MNKIKAAVVAAGVAAMALAPVAHADPDNRDNETKYIDALKAAGFMVGKNYATALTSGHWICDKLAQGLTPADVSSEYQSNTFTAQNADQYVAIAIKNLCPQYTPKPVATTTPTNPSYAPDPNNTDTPYTGGRGGGCAGGDYQGGRHGGC